MCLTAHHSQGMLIRRPKGPQPLGNDRGLPGRGNPFEKLGDVNVATFFE